MNRDDVKAWMAQCGAAPADPLPKTYDEFADVFLAVVNLAVAAEREACARFGEQKADEILKAGMLTEHYAVLQYAQAIRARSNP